MGVRVDDLPLHRQSFAQLAARAQRLRDDRATARGARTMLPRRIALLGDYTTAFVARVLDVFLFDLGVDAEIYESPYGLMLENVLNPESDLYRFEPEITLLLTHQGNLEHPPALLATAGDVAALAQAEASRWEGYWALLGARLKTRIVQSNFELPSDRALGNYDGLASYGRVAYVREVNACLRARATGRVVLFDLEYAASRVGLDRAIAPKSQFLTKQPFSFEFLVSYCHGLARSIALVCGLAKKCVVLDLDGTLWGGTLAEDGAARLVLGPDSAEGEAYSAFQRYLKALRDRGVLLAVCSKNDDAEARAVFASHPHMVLRPGDIACFVANWDDKASNVARIAEALHIGRDALVFVDDRPEERHLVRYAFPEVAVVDLPDDPADYVRALDEGLYFEVAELTGEATQRTESLLQDEQRSRALGGFEDYGAYLRSLDLRAEVRPIAADTLPRCAELMLRSNQWNLRTVRHSEADLRAFLARAGNVGFCVSLADRYGHYGIISVVLLERRPDDLFIDTWLMSCRVLKKGVEQLVFEEILRHGRASGVTALRGEYRPTGKNAMVKELLPSFGFVPATGHGEGVWEIALERALSRYDHCIQVGSPGAP